MSQSPDAFTVPNSDGATYRAAVNADLQALASNSGGTSAPSSPYAGQFWADTTTGLMKQRDSTNSVWVAKWKLNGDGLSNVAIAATMDLGADGSRNIQATTGTGPVTSFGTSAQAGQRFAVVWNATAPVTYNGTSMILLGGANITPQTGEIWEMLALGSGNFLQLSRQGGSLSPAFDAGFSSTRGAMVYRGASAWAALGPAAAAGAMLRSGGPGADPAWQPKAVRAKFAPSDPTGITSTSGAMAGLGSTVSFTPVASGDVLIVFGFTINNPNNTSNSNAGSLRYGTGTAPANGAALTGTQVAKQTFEAPTGGGQLSAFSPMTLTALVTGLTPGTTYWADLGLTPSGGTLDIFSVTAAVVELP